MTKKAWRVFVLVSSFLLSIDASKSIASSSNSPLSIHGEYSVNEAIHRTGGAGDKTSLRRGEFIAHEARFKIDKPLGEEWKFITNTYLRRTTDPQIDKRHDVHLMDFTSEVYNKTSRFTLGDFFADFSQYTMGQTLEGLQASAKTESLDFKMVSGYVEHGDEGKEFKRYMFGGRLEKLLIEESRIAKNWRLGLNFSDVEDDKDSIKTKAGLNDSSNQIVSFNSSILLWDKTEVEGELAESWLEVDNYTTDTSRRRADKKNGTALRLKSTTKFSEKTKFKFNYEWAQAYFNTLSGSATPDKVNIEAYLDSKWNKEWSSDASYRISYDKLAKSTLSKRTYTHVPKISLNWMPKSALWLLEDFFSRLYWEMRKRISGDDPSGQTDTVNNEFGIEDEFRVGKVNFNSGGSARWENDDLEKSNNRIFYNGFLGLRMRKKLFGIDTTPSLRWQYSYEDKPKQREHDVTNTVIEGLNLDISDSVSFEQRYSITALNRVAHDADTVKQNVYLGLDYKINGKEEYVLKLTYDFVNFHHPSPTECFSEHNIQTKFILKF